MKRMKLLSKFLVVLLVFFQTSTVFAQEPDPVNTGKALFQNAYKKGINIEAGVGVSNFLITETKATFGQKLNLFPNSYEYYVASSAITTGESTGKLFYAGFRLGKRMYRDTPERADTVSITNCESIDFYFAGASLRFPIMRPIGTHMYWSLNPGFYADFIIGNMEPEIKNGNLETDMVIVKHTEAPQTLKPLDLGAMLSFEFGFRAAYTGLSFRTGLRNLAPDNTDMTIRNNGLFNFYVGYRFESDIAKQDQKKIDNLINR
jgi:hypothetical protein